LRADGGRFFGWTAWLLAGITRIGENASHRGHGGHRGRIEGGRRKVLWLDSLASGREYRASGRDASHRGHAGHRGRIEGGRREGSLVGQLGFWARMTRIRLFTGGRPRTRIDLARARQYKEVKDRAGNRVRTDDLLITNQLLYQLSYAGLCREAAIHNQPSRRPKAERGLIQAGFTPKPSARETLRVHLENSTIRRDHSYRLLSPIEDWRKFGPVPPLRWRKTRFIGNSYPHLGNPKRSYNWHANMSKKVEIEIAGKKGHGFEPR
jgi:hypothetical protein